MQNSRRGFLLGLLAGALPLSAAAAAPRPEPTAPAELLVPAQYADPPPRYRRRCRLVRRRILVRDRWGRARERFVTREVCR